LLVAAVLGTFGIIVGRVPEYRVQVQDWLSDRTGVVVEFRALSARLRLFGPELVFDDAVVRTPDRTQVLATARRGSVGFDIWSSLRNGQLSAGRFSLRAPQINLIRTREGRIQLLGQSALPQRSDTKPIAIEQLPTGRFRVTNAVVSFRDELTGRGPWSMSGVSFDLIRNTNSMRLTGEASLPASLGRALRFSANADGGLQQPEAVVSTFTVAGEDLDLAGWADVFPDAWPAPETGRGSLQISASLRGPQLTQFTANVDFRNISTALPMWSIPLPRAAPMPVHANDEEMGDEEAGDEEIRDEGAAGDEEAQEVAANPALGMTAEAVPESELAALPPLGPEMVSYERVAFSMRAHQMAGQWNVTLSDLDVSRTGTPWRSDRIEAQWRQADGTREAKLTADRVVLDNVWPLLAYFPENETLARLRALRAKGVVEALSAELVRDAASTSRYNVEASLTTVGFAPILRAPGLSGISGKLQATEREGELQVQSSDVGFELPRMFRQALGAQSVDGTVAWTVGPDGVTARSDELKVVTADGRASTAVHVFVPREGTSPVLRLNAHGEDLNVAATAKYVPGHKLSRKTLDWFDRAFVGGRIPAATFSVDGPIRAFPFRAGEGTFSAQATVEDATLAFHESWLPATAIDAEVEFRNAGMTVRASSAQIGSLAAKDATATIRDFKQNDLRIAGRTSGELTDALAFLKASPLAATLDPHLQRIEGTGAMTADVQLYFPIKHLEDRDVIIAARLANASLGYGNLAPLRALQGSVKIHNTLLEAAEIEGRWLSGPLSFHVEPQDSTSSLLTARGRASAAPLKSLLALPASIGMSGAADWQVTTTLSTGDRTFGDARLIADVRDLGLALPEPVGKQEGEAGTLDLEMTVEERDRVLARASLGELRALVSLKNSGGRWQLDRGGLRADAVTASLPSHRGIRIEGAIERFVLDDWLELKGSGQGKPLSTYLQAANVRVGHFEMFGYQWTDVRGILQATPSGWRIDVSGPGAAGQVLIPEPFVGAAPLRAAMERLVLAKAAREASKEDDTPTDPRDLPGLDVHIMDVRMGERSIGAVDLSASRSAQGLRFDEIRVSGASVRAEGRGNWFVGSQGARSSLTATVTSTDVSATLQALDYTPFLEAQHGEIRADLNWPGGFDGNILEQASGTISVRAENGQIVNLQPGAGRMLGLFSVAALPRRLALDFSDLTDKGLAFDTIHGDFNLRDGNAYTDNLLLRGPAAEIGIAGRTGFAARDYDQTAVVTGNLGASLPVAGALAGGPAVGAALLLFSQVFKEPLKGMTRGYYRITGPWENPNVERVGASDAKDATARAAQP
jgi:uncharacterized protein (TIGR02099 family)